MTVDETFSENFRIEAARRKKDHATIGRAIGMDPRQLRKRARGETRWTLAEAEAVAKYLGLDVATLLRPAASSR